MNGTTTKKGAAGKFLALLASLTMMLAGLVGVAFAAPASAASQEVCAGYDSGKIDTTGDPKTVQVTAPEGQLIDGYCVKAGSDQSVENGAVVWVPVDPPQKTVTISHPSGKAVSHYALSYTPQEFAYSKQVTITETICTAEGTIVDATAKGELISDTKSGADFTTEEKAAIDKKAQDSAQAAFDEAFGEYSKGACEDDFVYSAKVTITDTICTSGGTIVDATATGAKFSDVKTGSDFTTEEKAAIYKKAQDSAQAAFDEAYGTHTVGACTTPPPPGCTVNCGTTVITEEPPVVTPPVVEAVQIAVPVVAPLAATVAPAKKPVVVNAPKPAKVEGGVAGTVNVPQTATVPAAVPAGDGSQAPGLPMWALALIVVGALGAAAAGKQMLGARN